MDTIPQSPGSLEGATWTGQRPWSTWKNVSGADVVAFSLLRITGSEVLRGQIVYHCDSPDNDGVCGNLIIVNGPQKVIASAYGICQTTWPAMVKLSSGSPVVGNLYGAKASQFLIDSSRAGFTCVADAGNNRMLVMPGPFVLKGKCSSTTWNVDTDADVSIWQGRDAGSVTSPLVTVNARNKFANITAAGDAQVAWNGWQWDLIDYRCPGI